MSGRREYKERSKSRAGAVIINRSSREKGSYISRDRHYDPDRQYRSYRDGDVRNARDRSRNRDRSRDYRSIDRHTMRYRSNDRQWTNQPNARSGGRRVKDSRSRSYRSTQKSSRSGSSDIDDTIGHYEGNIGDKVKQRYMIEKELGTGTFGKVFYCLDKKYNDYVALKVVRSIERYIDSAKIEAKILSQVYNKLKEFNSESCMRMYSHFAYNGHYCMVCEPLGKSLYDYIKENDYVGFPLHIVRDVSRQLLDAMNFLERMNLIHTDLKLENVLFVHTGFEKTSINFRRKTRSVILPTNTQIKLIDFGGATFDDDKSKGTIINTRQYRGPEVTLEIGWSFPSDMWSVGCIIAEVYSGELLFPAHEDVEHMAMFERCLGQIPQWMQRKSDLSRKFFHSDGRVRMDGLSSQSKRAISDVLPLHEFFDIAPEDKHSGIVELMTSILCLDPERRIRPTEALRKRFFES